MEINTDDTAKLNFAIDFLDKIFAAAGDPEGKLTPIELVGRIRRMHGTLSALIYQTEDPPTVTLQQVGELAAEALQ